MPRSLGSRLVLAFGVMLLPVVAVAASDVITFRASLVALDEVSNEGVEEARAIGRMRTLLVSADDPGEAYVETGDLDSGERFEAIGRQVEREFDALTQLLDSDAEANLAASARRLWDNASDAVTIAVSAPPEIKELELDRFHDSLDQASSVTTDLYSVNVNEVAARISSLRAREQVQLYSSLVILGLSSFAAVVIASRLRRSITKPLGRLEQAAGQLGSDNLSYRIQVQGEDELAHLSKAFNDMADRLEGSREAQDRSARKIERLNADLERRVAARTSALEEAMLDLDRAKHAAEEASQVKSEFLSRTSHELRTPLNAILGFGQLLQNSTLSTKDLQNVEQIMRGGRHLLGLINDVLDISQFDEGKTSFSLESVSLGEIVAESVDLVRPQAAAREIRLEVEGVDPSWFVHADRQRLRQVLNNLLSNAVKFNRVGGTVIVSAFPDSTGAFVVRVADTGPGIPADRRDRLFVPFDRLGAERTDIEGSGLGLALSKALVEAMGGKIRVEATNGSGAAFLVELSAGEQPSASPEERVDPRANTEYGIVGTVLCVEDNPSNLALVEGIMSLRPGVVLLTANEGQRGVEVARQQQPSLMLLDLHLPDSSGEETLRLLRDDPSTSHIPVVVTSADATPGTISRLLTSGANDYLTKPLKVAQLLAVVDAFLPAHTASLREGVEAS